jgi:transcriptional regulator with XRE-family HTH domain
VNICPCCGQRIRTPLARLLREVGMTQSDLAQATGLTRSYINQLATGRTEITPGLTAARRIAKALGKSVDDVFPESSES